MSRFKGPGTPYPVPGTTLFVQKFDYSAAPWRITDGKGNQQHQFLHFDTRRDALIWGAKTTHLPWATPAGEWTDADKKALIDIVLQAPGYESYLRAIGASRAYASPVELAPVYQAVRQEPVYQAPVRPEPTPLYDLPDPSAATFQNRQMGVDTPAEWRLPNRLFISDLGLSVVPMDVREQFPEGVRFYQVVDAHMGYQDAESELLRAGFGHARSGHYSALDIPEFFRDAEGHSVHRWIRLFTGGGPKNPLRVWRDETPASSHPAPPPAPVPPGQMKMWNPPQGLEFSTSPETRGGRNIVAIIDGRWVGGIDISFDFYNNQANVTRIEVDPKWRRRGVGTALYQKAAEISARYGLYLVSDTSRSNEAEEFWSKQERKGRATFKEGDGPWPTGHYVLKEKPPKTLENPRKKVQQKPADWLHEMHFETHRGATLPVTVSCGSDWYPEAVTEALEKRYSNQIERVSFGRKLPDGTTEADVLWVLFRPDTLDYLDRADRSSTNPLDEDLRRAERDARHGTAADRLKAQHAAKRASAFDLGSATAILEDLKSWVHGAPPTPSLAKVLRWAGVPKSKFVDRRFWSAEIFRAITKGADLDAQDALWDRFTSKDQASGRRWNPKGSKGRKIFNGVVGYRGMVIIQRQTVGSYDAFRIEFPSTPQDDAPQASEITLTMGLSPKPKTTGFDTQRAAKDAIDAFYGKYPEREGAYTAALELDLRETPDYWKPDEWRGARS